MYRVILIDDEPLILAGIASLICWEDHECAIVGEATNGHTAIDLILEARPDIVITDIRMPVMNGLEVIEACKRQGCEFSFICLTNLEDFQLAKQALRLGATDYLVKLDLQPQALIQALNRAKEYCSRMESHHNKKLYDHLLQDNKKQLEYTYFSQLIQNPTEADFGLNPEIAASYPVIYLILLQMKPEQILFGQAGSYDFQFIASQLQDVVSGIASRYFSGYTILEPQKDTRLLVVSPKAESDNRKSLADFCTKVNVTLGTYFALTALFGVSRKKTELSLLGEAAGEARSALDHCYYDSASRIVFYGDQDLRQQPSTEREFNINFLKKPMSAAVADNKSQDLREIFSQLSQLFTQYKPNKTQAASACINIYTYLHDLLQNEGSENNAFPYTIDIAEQLSQLGSLDDILAWLDSFCEKVCALLTDRKENRSDRLVYLAKRYIHEHYTEKLTLSDIADYLKISSGHLSSTFSRYMNQTVSDYIAEVKIAHAKELIDSGQYLIYEIADQLGFENAYYFSKVFKKVTGMSPKNYEGLHKQNHS
ncbi:MAG: response regulator [Hungatella sp.]|nr:response regulator [Hungatella sp.]